MNITTNQVKLYRNSIHRVIYFTLCLLLIGLHLSCGVDKDGGGTAPSINYDPLRISSFSVENGNGSPVNDTNAIPVDASFLLTFDESLGNIDNHVNSLVNQIEILDVGGGGGNPITLKVESTSITNQIKITPTTDLIYSITYQLTIKEGLTIGNYRVTNDITYTITTEKTSEYQVRFYQGANLLDTVSVDSLTMIPVSDYPVSPNAGKAYRWHSNANLGGVFNKDSLVIADVDLYAQEVPVSFEMIIENRIIPSDLANYGEMSEIIFSSYTAGATVVVRYVKEVASGSGDGSSWDNASGDIQAVVNGINDASENKVYVVLVASGTYKPSASYVMKNHVALIGGFVAGGYDRAGDTRLDGNKNKRVFNNNGNGLDRTALLYGVVITNGNAGSGNGGGMYNNNSSPTLINVTFSSNTTASWNGGGMYNNNSSPTLNNVTFSGNESKSGGGMLNNNNSSPTLNNVTFSGNESKNGGGMYNLNYSSPTLNNVTFSGNTADDSGGGMLNNNNSSPTLINVTFSGNTADDSGGGIANDFSSPALINVTFSGNTADNRGGGMYNSSSSSLTLINVTFSGNTVKNGRGGGMYNNNSSPTLINVTLFNNMVNQSEVGGGIYHDGNGQSLTLINMILSGNNGGNIYLRNDTSDTETVSLYYSRIFGGINASTAGDGIRLENANTSTYPVAINSKEVITGNPGLGSLADNGGGIDTISISSSSPAKDKGVYVRGVKAGNTYPEANLYYSKNNTDWYSDLDLTTQENPPSDADDLTATDARGYSRVGRPDMGAYEEGGTGP